jgi:MFS family permease
MLNIFANRDMTLAVFGRMVSTFGDGVALIALTLRLQADGARPYEVALLLAAGILPLLLLAAPVGRLVDTRDSRRLLVAGGLAEVAATIPLIIIHSVVPIVALVAALGAASSVTSATWSALIPRIVGDEQLAEAVSAQTAANTLMLVGAPAAGGLLAGAFGTGLPLTIDAATFVVLTVAAGLVRTRRAPGRVPTVDESTMAGGGFAIIRNDRILAPLLPGVALVVLLVGMVDVVLVFLIRVTLHAGGIWYGVAEASWMAGMVAGSVAAGRIRTERGQVHATITGVAVICVGLTGFAAAPIVGLLVPLSILGGVGNGYAGACGSTLLLARTPDSARGRVSAAANAVLGGAQGVSFLIGGAVTLILSPRAIYATAGLLGLATAGILAATVTPDNPNPATPVEPSPLPPATVESIGKERCPWEAPVEVGIADE